MKKFILLLSAVILTACGGGGSGGTSTSTVAPVAPVSMFSSTPTSFPDIQSIYASMCGTLTNIQNPVVIDLNKDGKKDLIFNVWCNQTAGALYVGPTTSGLIAFIQNADGSFRLATQEVFGINSDVLLIDGVSIENVVHDFNGDGYDDFVLSVSREDGRANTDSQATNMNTQNIYVMSTGTGTYNVIHQGQSAWNYGLVLVDNKDVVSMPIGYGHGVESYSYVNGWTQTTGYEWLANRGTSPLFFTKSTGSDTALTGSDMSINFGLSLFKKANGAWSQADSYKISDFQWVNFLSWQQMTGQVRLITLNGQDYASPSIEQTCQLKLRPTDTSSIAVATMSAMFITGNYQGNTLVQNNTLYPWQVKLLGVDVSNDHISMSANFQVNNEVTTASAYKLSCGDINGDGYDDIVLSDWQANSIPMIYLNDGTGTFNLVASSKIPGVGSFSQGQAFILTDMDGDGIPDILYYPVVGVSSGPVKLQMFKGQRRMTSTDAVH
jgi:hypothetical protein